MNISPQEVQLNNSRPHVSVRTRIGKDLLDSGDLLLRHVRTMGLAAGDHITVQVMSEYDELLHEAEFVVTKFHKAPQQVESGNTVRSITHIDCAVAKVRDWVDFMAEEVKAEKIKEVPPPQYANDSDWKVVHKGFGKFDVVDGGGNVKSTGLDKETAHGIARGDLPVS